MPVEASAGQPLLSVIVPTHDVGPWMSETLESILLQDIEDMEVLIVDDRSSDDTLAIARRYAARDGRVQVLTGSAPGGGSARNTGALAARGRYLIFCDADDLVPEGAYRALVDSLERSGSDVAFGDFLKFSPADTWRPTENMAAYGVPAVRTTLADAPTLIYARPCWNKAFRRDFWLQEGLSFPDVPRSNDIVPMTTAYLRARSIDVLPDVVYLYRERPGGGSMTAKSGSPTSLLSFLEQEAQCARLVQEAEHEELSSCYARLVWDRDTFVHVAKFARARDPLDVAAASDVSAAVRTLLELTPSPTEHVSQLKRLTLQFAAAGLWDAADAAARIERGDRTAPVFDLWTGLLRGYGQAQIEEPLNERVRWLLLRDLQRGVLEPDVAESWSTAAETAAALLPELVRCVSEIGSAELPPGEVIPLRVEVGGDLVRATGGRSLVLEGTVLRRVDPLVPVLWGVDRHDVVVDPSSVEWQETESGWTWRAAFDARDLPLYLNLQVAIRMRGVVVAVAAAGGLPEYSVLDRFIFEHHRESVVVYRRRSVPVRAVRRTIIKLRDRATNGRR